MTRTAQKKRPAKGKIGELATLIQRAGARGMLVSVDGLAHTLNIHPATLRGWLRKLVKEGRITTEKRSRGMLKLVWSGAGATPDAQKNAREKAPDLYVVEAASKEGKNAKSAVSGVVRKSNRGKALVVSESEIRSEKRGVEESPPEASPAHGNAHENAPFGSAQEDVKRYTEKPPPEPLTRWWEGRNWTLTVISAVFLTVSLTQSTLHAAERAHDDLVALFLIGAIALGIGLAAPVCLHEAVRRTSWLARIALASLGLAAFIINTAGSLGYTGARASTSAAQSQASVSARADAEADLKRLRERQALLDREAVVARTEKSCGTPHQCRQRGEKLAKEAAAIAPQIEAARKTLDTKEVKAAADPAAMFIADLIGLKDGPVRQSFVLSWALFAETVAAFGFALAVRRRRA